LLRPFGPPPGPIARPNLPANSHTHNFSIRMMDS